MGEEFKNGYGGIREFKIELLQQEVDSFCQNQMKTYKFKCFTWKNGDKYQ